MKKFAMVLLISIGFCSPALAGDYILTIDGTAEEIQLENKQKITLKDGKTVEVFLQLKDVLQFQGELFSFEYRNEYKPNRQDLGDGVFQTMIVTPLGTGVLIQEYLGMDPAGLVDLMVKELTKEEVEYGYKYSAEPVTRKVGKKKLTGTRAVTKYRGEEWTRDVLAYSGKDQGILVITFIEQDNYSKEMDLIDGLWSSLQLLDK